MKTTLLPEHPFEGIDIAQLDEAYPSLLERGAEFDSDRKKFGVPGMALSSREKWLFRFGILSGVGEWEMAGGMLASSLESGLLRGPEVERAAAECVYVMGMRVSFHLGPFLSSFGLCGPADSLEALRIVRSPRHADAGGECDPGEGLSEREIFALGLGVAWGAGCWDT